MSLVDLIAQADERGLAASGLACLDRCVPLLGGDDEVLRPLWSSLVDGGAWSECLERARTELDAADPGQAVADEDEAAVLVRRMLAAAPDDTRASDLREWADACSVAALRIHRLLDATADDTGTCPVSAHREGDTDGISPSSRPNCAARSPSWSYWRAGARADCAPRWRCPRRDGACCARWCRGGPADARDAEPRVRRRRGAEGEARSGSRRAATGVPGGGAGVRGQGGRTGALSPRPGRKPVSCGVPVTVLRGRMGVVGRCRECARNA